MTFGYSVLVVLLVSFQESHCSVGCAQKLLHNSGFMECISDFFPFIRKLGEVAIMEKGKAVKDGSEAMKMMCTDEGKAYMKCITQYMKNCPEVMQQSGALKLSPAMLQSGVDELCSIPFGDKVTTTTPGPCATVQQCIKSSSNDGFGSEKEMTYSERGNIMNAMMSINPYLAFLEQASMICGPMKMQLECMVKHLDKCPVEVKEAEKMLKSSIEISIQGDNAWSSYDDMKIFMNEKCQKMPTDLSKDPCLRTSLSSSGFMTCYENATDSYISAKDGKCTMYDLQSVCLDTYVSGCGKETTDFMKSNLNRIIKNVPASCTLRYTSSAPGSVQLATTSIVMLALSVFFILKGLLNVPGE